MIRLGVFTTIYPDGVMTIGRALLISVVGFLLVFMILGTISLFVKLMGAVFGRIKKAVPAQTSSSQGSIDIPLPETQSDGSLILENVSEEEAAVIMAIVSDQSGVPLNRLQFNSIRLLEDNNNEIHRNAQQ